MRHPLAIIASLSVVASSFAIGSAAFAGEQGGSAQTATKNTAHRHRVCTKSSGTTGLVVGGVAGAVIGDKAIGHGVLGPVVGAAGGALAGRAIDRTITAKRRCHWVND